MIHTIFRYILLVPFVLLALACTKYEVSSSGAQALDSETPADHGDEGGLGETPVLDPPKEDPSDIPPAHFPGAGVVIPDSVANGSSSCSSARRSEALEYYEKLDPAGYQVYLDYTSEFLKWFDECGNLVGTFGLALHETIHHVTDVGDSYPLLNGESVPRVAWQNSPYYAPKELYNEFNSKDPGSDFIDIYLSGSKAGSGNYYRYLLDEFNAYTHDARTSLRTHRLKPRSSDVNWRDGLTMMMAFVKAYARRAKEKHPRTWAQLNTEEDKRILGALWRQAEVTLVQSCPYTTFYTDKIYLQRLCDASTSGPLKELLGWEPVCPQDCLDRY